MSDVQSIKKQLHMQQRYDNYSSIFRLTKNPALSFTISYSFAIGFPEPTKQ